MDAKGTQPQPQQEHAGAQGRDELWPVLPEQVSGFDHDSSPYDDGSGVSLGNVGLGVAVLRTSLL